MIIHRQKLTARERLTLGQIEKPKGWNSERVSLHRRQNVMFLLLLRLSILITINSLIIKKDKIVVII